MKMKKLFFTSIIFLTFFSFLNAESFRIRKANISNLQANQTDETQFECGVYDAVAIYLPDDKTFIEGIEIKMAIPEAIASWRDTVAASIYDNISPAPTANQIDYSGTRLFVSTLPGRLSWVLQIPLDKNNSIKENQYSTKIDTIPSKSAKTIFLRFQPIMKGIPEETLNAKIGVSVRPILTDKGKLSLSLSSADKQLKQYSVYIDDRPIDTTKDIILSTGHHNLSIISEDYRNEVRKFYIEQAKTTNIEIDLKGVEPTLLINAPDGTLVYLDDKPCKEIGKEFIISEGEHSVKFIVGSYEVVRTITATKGKTYKANFEIDLTITDE